MASEREMRERLQLLTADEVCELMQVTKDWLYDVCQRGQFPVRRIGRQLRFRPLDVEAYIEGTWKAESPEEDSPLPKAKKMRGRKAVAAD